MAKGWIDLVAGVMEQKKRYRQYQARAKQLPADYHAAIEALERYIYIFGPGDSDSLVPLLESLAELFEESAANGTPLRAVVGEDPVVFVDEFLRNYPQGQWISQERDKLTSAISRAAGQAEGTV